MIINVFYVPVSSKKNWNTNMPNQDNTKLKLLVVFYVTLCFIQTVQNRQSFILKTTTRTLRHVQNILGSFTADMELQCARSCSRNPLCSAIAVRTVDRVCVVLSRTGTGPSHVGGPEWSYYETDHDDCQTSDVQMYVRELGTCLWVHPEGNYSIYDSVDICEESNGHLVKVDSEQKRLAVEDMMGDSLKRTFLQGNDTLEEGVWRFDDGSVMTYFNWNTGMPRNKTQYNFVLMRRANGFRWQDQDVYLSNIFTSVVCEKYLD